MSISGPVLICAATAVEARACRSGVERAGPGLEVLQTGMGIAAAERALRARLATGPKPGWIISSGFAGTRDARVALGAWLWARSLRRDGTEILLSGRLESVLARSGLGASAADFLTVDAVEGPEASLPADVAVDMESVALGRVAAEAGIPFDVLRVVSDTLEQPLPKAIGLFTAATLETERAQKVRRFSDGLLGAVREPGKVLGFALRAARLPGVLTDGWSKLAPAFVNG